MDGRDLVHFYVQSLVLDAPISHYAYPIAARRLRRDGQQTFDRGRAASRAFDIIEYFRTCSRPARLTHIARALGIPNSSADDLLRVMVAKGYLAFENRKKLYYPSYKLLRTFEDVVSRFPWIGRMRELERSLHEKTGQTVLVAVQDRSMFRIESVAEGPEFDPRSIDFRLRPLAYFSVDSGWLPTSNFSLSLLASNSDAKIMEFLSDLGPRGEAANYLPFLERVRTVRRLGYARCGFARVTDTSPFLSYSKGLPVGGGWPMMAIGCVGHQREVETWRGLFEDGMLYL